MTNDALPGLPEGAGAVPASSPAPDWQPPDDIDREDLLAQFGCSWAKGFGHIVVQNFAKKERSLGQVAPPAAVSSEIETIEQVKRDRSVTRANNLLQAHDKLKAFQKMPYSPSLLWMQKFDRSRAATYRRTLDQLKSNLDQATVAVQRNSTDSVDAETLPTVFHHEGRLALGRLIYVIADGDILHNGLPVFEARVVTEYLCDYKDFYKTSAAINFEYKLERQATKEFPWSFDLIIVAAKGELALKNKYGYQLFLDKESALTQRAEIARRITERLAATVPAL